LADLVHPRSQSVDQRHEPGPFDVIGDVHGCTTELEDLFERLAYDRDAAGVWWSPAGRTAVFVGDLVDRGPRIVGALRTVMAMVAAGVAYCVPGNHDLQLARVLAGEDVPIVYGLDTSLAELDRESAEFRMQVAGFFEAIKGHYVFDDGRLVVAHTGLAERLHGVDTWESRMMAAYGVVDGEIDGTDLAKRHSWLAGYRDAAVVVYGHTPVSEARWHGPTIDIDTGCVYGGRLTALQWPERTLVSVPARRRYHPRGD
jgi:diadenosine tetraphosphatase ApaH/serine/threonine PP2A family protein phosphatase